jgi:hypothetical protein
MQFASLNGLTIGKCTRWSIGERQIEIDQAYWQDPTTTENEKISLIFHELGHCDLNRNHDESLRQDGYPKSLMCPYNLSFFDEESEYYYAELFGRDTSNLLPVLSLSSKAIDTDHTHEQEPCVVDVQ